MDDEFDLFDDDDYFSVNIPDETTSTDSATNDQEAQTKKFQALPKATIFLVDCHKTMQIAQNQNRGQNGQPLRYVRRVPIIFWKGYILERILFDNFINEYDT